MAWPSWQALDCPGGGRYRVKSLQLIEIQRATYCSAISVSRRGAHITDMDRNILYKCPRTGLHVQHLLTGAGSSDAEAKDEYVSVLCPACASLHFIDSRTGALLVATERAVGLPSRPGRTQGTT